MSTKIKSDAIKWICVTLAVLVLAVGVTAAMTKGFTDWNPYGWLDKKTDAPADTEDNNENLNDSLVVTPDAQSAGVRLSVVRLAANDGADRQANNSHVITANVVDQYGVACELMLSCSFEWVNPTSENVSDYVSARRLDNENKWLLSCAKPFGIQILFRVFVPTDHSTYATATVDYAERVDSIKTSFDTTQYTIRDGDVMTIQSSTRSGFYNWLNSGDHSINLYSQFTKTEGTIVTNYSSVTVEVYCYGEFDGVIPSQSLNATECCNSYGANLTVVEIADFFGYIHGVTDSDSAASCANSLFDFCNQYRVVVFFAGERPFMLTYYLNFVVDTSVPSNVSLSSSGVVF